MQEPIRAKLEEYSRKLGQAKHTKLATANGELRKAEAELESGSLSYMYPIVGFFVLGILSIILIVSTGSDAFGILTLIGVLWLIITIFTGYDEKAGQAKILSITSKIGNINSEITVLQTSIENINTAIKAEENLDYKKAIALFDQVGLSSEAKRIRTKMHKEGKVKVDQTVVHGDYVDDRDTIIKDSVINRSSIGVGGDDKLGKIKELKELLDSGAISEEDYQKMKREIVG